MNLDKVVACLKSIGFKPKINEFQDRLIIQKMVYLLQLKGLKTNYRYNLYVRGPYSPQLTSEIYAHKNKLERLELPATLSLNESKAINSFNELFSELKPSILEIAATYSFFAFGSAPQDALTALKNVKKMKPFYSQAQISIGVSKAKEFLFQPTEKELIEMKDEAKAWQNASLQTMRG